MEIGEISSREREMAQRDEGIGAVVEFDAVHGLGEQGLERDDPPTGAGAVSGGDGHDVVHGEREGGRALRGVESGLRGFEARHARSWLSVFQCDQGGEYHKTESSDDHPGRGDACTAKLRVLGDPPLRGVTARLRISSLGIFPSVLHLISYA